jgi:hypothetical protein
MTTRFGSCAFLRCSTTETPLRTTTCESKPQTKIQSPGAVEACFRCGETHQMAFNLRHIRNKFCNDTARHLRSRGRLGRPAEDGCRIRVGA